jgi:hypothetical protein
MRLRSRRTQARPWSRSSGIALVGAGVSVTRELAAGTPPILPRTRRRIADDVANIEEAVS